MKKLLTLLVLCLPIHGQIFGPASRVSLRPSILFADLPGDAANGTFFYVSDGTAGIPCTGSGTGAVAVMVAGAWNCSNGSSGTGDVVGPGSSTDNAIVRFDSTTGKLIQNSTITVNDAGELSTQNNIKAPTIAAASTTFRAVTSNVATLTTSTAHGLLAGNQVQITGMTDATYNGGYVIQSVPTTTTFTYLLTHANESTIADSAGTVTYRPVVQIGAPITTATSTSGQEAYVSVASPSDNASLQVQCSNSRSGTELCFYIDTPASALLAVKANGNFGITAGARFEAPTTTTLMGYASGYHGVDGFIELTSDTCYHWGTSTSDPLASVGTSICQPSAGLVQLYGANATTKASLQTVADANGSKYTDDSSTELLPLSTSGTTTSTVGNLALASSDVEAILARVTTTITTATDWSIAVTSGIASCTNAWVATGTTTTAQTGLTAGTTVVFKPAAGLQCHTSVATTLTITTTGTPGAGVIRLTPIIKTYTVPTS